MKLPDDGIGISVRSLYIPFHCVREVEENMISCIRKLNLVTLLTTDQSFSATWGSTRWYERWHLSRWSTLLFHQCQTVVGREDAPLDRYPQPSSKCEAQAAHSVSFIDQRLSAESWSAAIAQLEHVHMTTRTRAGHFLHNEMHASHTPSIYLVTASVSANGTTGGMLQRLD